jgi:hypothetical protein
VLAGYLLILAALCHPGFGPMSSAEAHPEQAGIGHRVDIRVGPADARGQHPVVLDYVAEIPGARLYQEASAANDPRYPEHLAASLAGGVGLAWNGASLPMTDEAVTPVATEGDRGFVDLHLRRLTTLPGDDGEVKLLNRNYPEDASLFATWVQLPGSLVVGESTLVQVRDGILRKNRHGAWLKGADDREPSFRLRPAGVFERREGLFSLPERMAGLETLARPWWVDWGIRGGLVGVLIVGGLLVRSKRRST